MELPTDWLKNGIVTFTSIDAGTNFARALAVPTDHNLAEVRRGLLYTDAVSYTTTVFEKPWLKKIWFFVLVKHSLSSAYKEEGMSGVIKHGLTSVAFLSASYFFNQASPLVSTTYKTAMTLGIAYKATQNLCSFVDECYSGTLSTASKIAWGNLYEEWGIEYKATINIWSFVDERYSGTLSTASKIAWNNVYKFGLTGRQKLAGARNVHFAEALYYAPTVHNIPCFKILSFGGIAPSLSYAYKEEGMSGVIKHGLTSVAFLSVSYFFTQAPPLVSATYRIAMTLGLGYKAVQSLCSLIDEHRSGALSSSSKVAWDNVYEKLGLATREPVKKVDCSPDDHACISKPELAGATGDDHACISKPELAGVTGDDAYDEQ